MTAPDIFALGGRQDDAEILALFRRWIEGHRAADLIGIDTPEIDLQDQPAWLAVQDEIDELEQRIAGIPAAGGVGMAVKAYIASFRHHGASNKDAAALPEHAGLCEAEAGLLDDAARFVPEIAELTKWALE